MTNKATITYIKNGEEKTEIITPFNSKKIRKEIFVRNYDWGYKWRTVTINSDIEYIHFENVNLPHFTRKKQSFNEIKCNNNTICVIENCIIQNKRKNDTKTLKLIGGQFELINIAPKDYLAIIEMNSHKEISIDNSKIKNSSRKIYLDSFDDGFQKINIKDNESIQNIYLSGDNISLTGNFLLDDAYIASDNKIKIGNKLEETKIVRTNERGPGITIESNHLELINCTIIDDSSSDICLNYNEITADNFKIKSKGNIIINNRIIFSEKNKEGYVVITFKDLLRLKLNSILTRRFEQIDEQIDLSTQVYLHQHQNDKLLSNISKQEEIIRYNIAILEELKQELSSQENNRKNQIRKSLVKKPIKYYN